MPEPFPMIFGTLHYYRQYRQSNIVAYFFGPPYTLNGISLTSTTYSRLTRWHSQNFRKEPIHPL